MVLTKNSTKIAIFQLNVPAMSLIRRGRSVSKLPNKVSEDLYVSCLTFELVLRLVSICIQVVHSDNFQLFQGMDVGETLFAAVVRFQILVSLAYAIGALNGTESIGKNVIVQKTTVIRPPALHHFL